MTAANTDLASPMPRQRNPRGEGGRLRDEILGAAMRLLDRAPARELSLRMVAREAGVAAPSVYAHFANARSLMSEVVRACWRDLAHEMGAVAAGDTTDAFEALRLQVLAYVKYAMERPSHYQLLFALQMDDAATLRDLPGLVRPVSRTLRETVERFAAQGRALPMQDAFETTLVVLSMTHGIIALAQTNPHRPENSPANVGAFVVRTLERLFA